MKNHTVIFAESARKDLSGIWLFVQDKYSESTADEVIDELQDFCNDFLSLFPNAGRVRSDLRNEIRHFPHQLKNKNSYNIFYRVSDEKVYITHISHSSQDYSIFF